MEGGKTSWKLKGRQAPSSLSSAPEHAFSGLSELRLEGAIPILRKYTQIGNVVQVDTQRSLAYFRYFDPVSTFFAAPFKSVPFRHTYEDIKKMAK